MQPPRHVLHGPGLFKRREVGCEKLYFRRFPKGFMNTFHQIGTGDNVSATQVSL
jgi:hypothetical protein